MERFRIGELAELSVRPVGLLKANVQITGGDRDLQLLPPLTEGVNHKTMVDRLTALKADEHIRGYSLDPLMVCSRTRTRGWS